MTRFRRPSGDHGAAAVEFALFFVVLLPLLAIVAPLAIALERKIVLERAAGEAARYATQAPRGGPQPNQDAICGEVTTAGLPYSKCAAYAYTSASFTPIDPCGSTPTRDLGQRQPGDMVCVRVTKDVSLSLFGNLDMTLTATSLGRQE